MNLVYDLLSDFISLVFPRLCQACGDHLMRNEKVICTGCYISIPRTDFHLSPVNPVSQLFWGRCKLEKASVYSYYTHGSKMQKLIHNMKYRGMREIGFEMGKLYASVLKSSGFTDDIDLLIPVPLHASKQRRRGFNQSDYIALGISEVSGLPVEKSCLKRIAGKGTQTRSSRYDRWTNVKGTFSVENCNVLIGKHILLIDDVITTGSTIESCANELLSIENVRVSAIALAASVV
jgi:ComF family protein